MGVNDLQADIAARVRASGTSRFYSAMRLLPPDRRNAMFAIYAFCREVDDIADEDRPQRPSAASSPSGAPRSTVCMPAVR